MRPYAAATKKDPPRLLRVATQEDRRLYEAKLTREAEAYRSCSMKLVREFQTRIEMRRIGPPDAADFGHPAV